MGFRFVQMKGIAPLQREIIARVKKNTLKNLKNLLFQNQQAKFNQSGYKKIILG
jgi:hypothetical protein